MIYFTDINNVSDYLNDYKNIVVVCGSNEFEIAAAKKLPFKSISIPTGEDAKQLEVVKLLWATFSKFNIDRKSLVVSVGGGAISDSVGFAASTYMRGVDFASVPTTYLAMIDAAIGGKRAINTEAGKNMVGTFWDAKYIFIDERLLDTLEEKDRKSGVCELLKLKFITNKQVDSIKDAIEVKQSIVDEDVFDKEGKREVLNYGHTLGHAIEALYHIPHGIAIARGMDFAAYINHKLQHEQREIFKQYDVLNDILAINIDEAVLSYMFNDKKNTNGNINFIVLDDFGIPNKLTMNMEKTKHYLLEYLSDEKGQ
ncbi:MAG: 3-dehydroquinate synthase family protein [Coriobacteriia bacterium]|nr:3-dehydroquinate synthase family protein [Coriobacteriia bacterium]